MPRLSRRAVIWPIENELKRLASVMILKKGHPKKITKLTKRSQKNKRLASVVQQKAHNLIF